VSPDRAPRRRRRVKGHDRPRRAFARQADRRWRARPIGVARRAQTV